MSELKESFIRMIREYDKLIFKVCHCYARDHADREDMYQEIILQCWKAYPQFNGRSKESTWLYRISLNTAITHQRKALRRVPLKDVGLQELDGIREDGGGAEQEQLQLMYRMIAALPELERALLLLYFEDRPHTEIAEIMGISAGNVATRLGRIRNKLKQQVNTIY
jgi:RNA polymerase sigma-70 factor, ECF subfamily